MSALINIAFLRLQTHEREAGAGAQEQQNSNASFRAEQQQHYSALHSDFHTYPHAEQITVNASLPLEFLPCGDGTALNGGTAFGMVISS